MEEMSTEKRVRIKILEQEGDSQPVFVGVNFKGYAIQRGVEVDVPCSVFEALKNAVQTVYKDPWLKKNEERYAYPFQVIGENGEVVEEYKSKVPTGTAKQPSQNSRPEPDQLKKLKETLAIGKEDQSDETPEGGEQAFYESVRLKYIREEIEYISSLPAKDHRDYIDRSSSVERLKDEEQAILDYLAGKSNYSTTGHKFPTIKRDDIVIELTSKYQAPPPRVEKNQRKIPEWFVNYMNHLADKNVFYKQENASKILEKLLISHEDLHDLDLIDYIDNDDKLCFSKMLVEKKGAYHCRSKRTVLRWLQTWKADQAQSTKQTV